MSSTNRTQLNVFKMLKWLLLIETSQKYL